MAVTSTSPTVVTAGTAHFCGHVGTAQHASAPVSICGVTHILWVDAPSYGFNSSAQLIEYQPATSWARVIDVVGCGFGLPADASSARARWALGA